MIDAKDAKAIQDYLEPFKEAMSFVPSEDVESTAVPEEDEDRVSQEIDEELS